MHGPEGLSTPRGCNIADLRARQPRNSVDHCVNTPLQFVLEPLADSGKLPLDTFTYQGKPKQDRSMMLKG